MKKMLRGIFAALSAAVIIGLSSCSSDVQSYSSQIDTVLQLSAPSVKATAYPGMNYVSWTPVANAKEYYLYTSIDGHQISTQTVSASSALKYVDKSVKANATYTYRVEATSKTSTGRAVVTENAMSSSVSVKSIVPDYDTKPLDLYKFENGSRDEKYIVSASNIKAFLDDKTKIGISFPSKAYLTYDVYYSIDNEFDTYENSTKIETYSDETVNNSQLKSSLTVTKSGTYHFTVWAKAENTKYGKIDKVTADATVEIPTLYGNISDQNDNITSAAYVDENTVRIVFTGFTLLNEKKAPAEYYKVYRSEAATPSNYTLVSGTVKATNAVNSSFYVEDTVPDNTVKYIYTLVVTDGTSFASNTQTKECGIYSAANANTVTIATSVDALDEDGKNDDVVWTITIANKDVKITGVYELEVPYTKSYTPVAADFDRTTSLTLTSADNTNGTVYKAITKNHTPKSKVYLLVTTSEEGKKDSETITSVASGNEQNIAEISATSMSTPTLTFALYDDTVNGATPANYTAVNNDVMLNVKNTLSKHEAIGDFTYEVYQVNPKAITQNTNTNPAVDEIEWDYSGEDWKKLNDFEMKLNSVTDDDVYIGIIKLSNLEDGIYAWKVVKTEKATGDKVSSTIVCTEVNAATPVTFWKPATISAAFDDDTKATSDIIISFRKNNTVNPVAEEDDTSILYNYEIDYVDETEETGVTYELYRTDLVEKTKQSTKVVWTKIASTSNWVKDPVTTTGAVYEIDDTTDPSNPTVVAKTEPVEFVDYIDYTYTDKNKSTGDGYQYMLVCTKGDVTETVLSAVIVPKN